MIKFPENVIKRISGVQNKAHFQVVLVSFFQVFWKLKYLQICSFSRRWKHHKYFHFTPVPTSSKILYFFNTSPLLNISQHAKKEREAGPTTQGRWFFFFFFCTEHSKKRNKKSSEFIWMPRQSRVPPLILHFCCVMAY